MYILSGEKTYIPTGENVCTLSYHLQVQKSIKKLSGFFWNPGMVIRILFVLKRSQPCVRLLIFTGENMTGNVLFADAIRWIP